MLSNAYGNSSEAAKQMTKATETIKAITIRVTKKIKLVAVKKTTLPSFGGSRNEQENRWKEISERMQQDLETFSKDREIKQEALCKILVRSTERYDYTAFLKIRRHRRSYEKSMTMNLITCSIRMA